MILPGADGVMREVGPQRFRGFLIEGLLSDKTFGEGDKGPRIGARLESKFSKAEEGDDVDIEDTDWEMLDLVSRTTSYHPVIGRKLVSFLDAIAKAESL